MKNKSFNSFLFLLTVIIIIIYVGCSKSNDTPATTTTTTSSITVKLANSSTLGSYLVDKNGVALYFFSDDFKGKNSCAGGCALYWPYFYAGKLTQDSLGTGLKLSDFDTIHVGTSIQTRYKNWPLYYYSPTGDGKPEASGITSGEAAQGVWFVAKPDYSIMLAKGQLTGLDGKNYTSTYTVGDGTTTYFTDAKGLTLYTFSVDSFNKNKFTNAAFSNNASWPIYDTTAMVVPSILNKALFNTITVFGHSQITYNGWPLYYFGQDGKIMGNTKGVSVPVAGKWPVAVKSISQAPEKAGSVSGSGSGSGSY